MQERREKLLYLLDQLDPAIAGLVRDGGGQIARTSRLSEVEVGQIAWTDASGKDWRAKFSRWLKRLGEEVGRLDFPVDKLATRWGELVERHLRTMRVVMYEARDIPSMYEEFEYVEGLSSCMTGEKAWDVWEYLSQAPKLGILVALDEEDQYRARALVWHDARDDETGEKLTLLDRVYYTSKAAAEILVQYATEQGWAYRPLGSGYVEFSNGMPTKPPFVHGTRLLTRVRAWLGTYERPGPLPFLDSLPYVGMGKRGMFAASYYVPQAWAFARHTDGSYSLIHDSEWAGAA